MLRFATFTSDIELPFYTSLASLKINHDKLDDSSRQLLGLYEIRPLDAPDASCRLQVHGDALTGDTVTPGFYRAEGMIKNVNTIEDYRNLDKTALLIQAGRTIWDAINDGTIYSCPSLLASFLVISFADLKKYKFTYLFGFPALHSEPTWRVTERSYDSNNADEPVGHVKSSTVHLSAAESTALVESVQTWRYSVDARHYGFFLAKKIRTSDLTQPGVDGSHTRALSPDSPLYDLGYTWVVGSLASYEAAFFDGVESKDRFVCFADPSTYADYPGWMLRNLLLLVRKRWGLTEVQVLCYRDIPSRREDARSMILRLELDDLAEVSKVSNVTTCEQALPRVSGWERSDSGKISSKIANLGDYMNPQRLADQAVDLNLKLIKWRISPRLDLDVIKNTKCLLLGAGTLGSYVARNLLGWGVRKITFVDNGSVSFSNPVRQPLFNFNDCLGGGAKKAHRAAQALKEIYPGVDAEGHVMSVPMAGHPILDETAVRKDYDLLARLMHEHDAVFLLMDTRESRWLPTVIGKATGKIVMNAALGFDTFLVMRHGTESHDTFNPGLGCYFCSDVVAPADLTIQCKSLADRTLDQQCTVTRPGIAAIASALLVEVFVSVLQHPLGALAPAPTSPTEDYGDHPLGAYEDDAWGFVKRALNEKGFVEDLSGLAEVQRAAEKALADIELIDDSDMTEEDEEPEVI
ncbi:MAG: hypothetical protein Q9220_000679 [cf. Caloplaca sp. 1 TL-2023]